jgi:hypothetical protein
MRVKVQNGTVAHGDSSLCTTCRLSTIIRGRTLDEEIVQCQALAMRPTRVTFKVTYCTAYSDARQPSYMQMMEHAWILQPGSKRRKAGFVRGADLAPDELTNIVMEIRTHDDPGC